MNDPSLAGIVASLQYGIVNRLIDFAGQRKHECGSHVCQKTWRSADALEICEFPATLAEFTGDWLVVLSEPELDGVDLHGSFSIESKRFSPFDRYKG